MSAFDRKFEITNPSLDYLIKIACPVSDVGLVTPVGTSPVPLIDGELVQMNVGGQYARASDAAAPSYFVLDTRGQPDVRVIRKVTAIRGGASFIAKTLVFDTALTAIGTKLGAGAVNNSLSGSVARWGLVAASTNWLLGTILRPASADSGGRLEVFITGL